MAFVRLDIYNKSGSSPDVLEHAQGNDADDQYTSPMIYWIPLAQQQRLYACIPKHLPSGHYQSTKGIPCTAVYVVHNNNRGLVLTAAVYTRQAYDLTSYAKFRRCAFNGQIANGSWESTLMSLHFVQTGMCILPRVHKRQKCATAYLACITTYF